jgi:hypothetical protein
VIILTFFRAFSFSKKNQNESTLLEVNRTDNALFILRQAGQVALKKVISFGFVQLSGSK